MAKGKGGFIGQDGLNAPDSPTGVSGSVGDTEVDVSFTAPSDVGGSAITGYRVQDSTGAHGASGSSSPITVTGLTNGTSYTFNVWAINAFGYSAPSDASESVSPIAANYALFAAGVNTSNSMVNTIDRININSSGNASDFGDTTAVKTWAAGCSSSTRGLFAGGFNTSYAILANIDYVTIATTGNAANFGSLSSGRVTLSALSSSTRGVFAGGNTTGGAGGSGSTNIIDYVTIASTGNATDFGDLDQNRDSLTASSNATRGVIAGGITTSSTNGTNVIQYITIASTGNASDFGDVSASVYYPSAASSSTRMLIALGIINGSRGNTVEYVTIASTGNSTDFGDLTSSRSQVGGTSNSTTAVFGGGQISTAQNTIDAFTIASTGNATDFGDLTVARREAGACSDSHGGLS